MGDRTSKGNVTASARKSHGDRKGKFPIFDHKSCMSAVKLRGHGDKSAILARAASWARKNKDSACLTRVVAAREADRKR